MAGAEAAAAAVGADVAGAEAARAAAPTLEEAAPAAGAAAAAVGEAAPGAAQAAVAAATMADPPVAPAADSVAAVGQRVGECCVFCVCVLCLLRLGCRILRLWSSGLRFAKNL